MDPNQAMEMAARAGGASYVIGRVMNQVTRSKYGKRLPQNATREIQPARALQAATGECHHSNRVVQHTTVANVSYS